MSTERMDLWKKRLSTNQTAYENELTSMDHREDMYRGKYSFAAMTEREDPQTGSEVKYVYNALAENIEAQVSSDIPMPKVTARRKQDERLAVIIENMLRNELDRLPVELINDQAERTVSIQGGGFYMVEWDNAKRSHGSVGEVALSFLHPKWVIPQNGVYTSMQDMDYFILKIPQTKESIKALYGVDLEDEAESEPEIKNTDAGTPADDMVTQYIAYYRNEDGAIGKYSWCNDRELEDIEDYQARHLCRCTNCGAVQPEDGEQIATGDEEPYEWHTGEGCPVCGGHDWTDSAEDWEEIVGPLIRTDGSIVPGTDGSEPGEELGGYGMSGTPAEIMPDLIDTGEPAVMGYGEGPTIYIPYYKPDIFPVVLQRNVSVFGRLLGESDADRQESMQNGLNRLEQKIFDRMLKAGDKILLPDNATLRVDTNDQSVWRVGSAADASMINHVQFRGDVSQEMEQVEQIYQHMRQTIGVTDSFQGRKDTTATSGTAKQFAAAQAAGRMESKRVMKERAYSELFEMMFKWRLAYADEPRPVVYQDGQGNMVYDTFSKWDFLERDESGQYWWNDLFLFSCDPAAPLAQNRERLWQETVSFYTAGVFGDPQATETRVEFWRLMEQYHYPGAAEQRKAAQDRLTEEQAAMELQADMRTTPTPEQPETQYTDAEVDEMARQAAMADAAQSFGS